MPGGQCPFHVVSAAAAAASFSWIARRVQKKPAPALAAAPAAASRPLYGRLMAAIRTRHGIGNTIRFFKLPLILLDVDLYGSAIAQFWWLTRTLEARLDARQDDPLIARAVGAVGVGPLAPAYARDLAEIFGPGFERGVVLTRATRRYAAALERADAPSLVAALFILYGALVVGGGKSTQAKVRAVFPRCGHALYDVADDMRDARRVFKRAFTDLGVDDPAAADAVVFHARRWMARNNEVVLSCRVVPAWWWKPVLGAAAAYVAARRLRR